MRWIRYEANGQTAYGTVDGDMVTEVRGNPFAGYEKTATRRPLSSVKLLVPVEPRTFYAAGLNYAEHAIAAANKRGEVPKLPEAADIGYRASNALIAHGEPIVIPADATDRVQYEAELVAVIGRKAKNLSESEALSCVLGWTIGNDMSERIWQAGDRTLWRAKNSDTFKPMGPYIVTADEADPLSSTTSVLVDGAVQASFPTGDMLFGPYEYISAISRYITLSPGDVLWLGTDETATCSPGQVVEITIDGVGTLTNPVTEEKLP
jgi:2-keto-4-pentenoate hydratase/2-oxohepta-3-ene-1,7-dioic acid hydratase in catechol pathway